MGDDPSSLDWEVRTSKVGSGYMILVPEDFRDLVSIDESEERATWWGLDQKTQFTFLADSYTQGERFQILYNQTYKLHSGSRVKIPDMENPDIDENGHRSVDVGDPIYFYTDNRMKKDEPRSVLVLDKREFQNLMRSEEQLRRLSNEVSINSHHQSETSSSSSSIDESDNPEKALREAHESIDAVLIERLPLPK